jgi:hypothetical protein
MEEQRQKYIVRYVYACDFGNAVVVKAMSPAEAEQVVRLAHRTEIGEDYEDETGLVVEVIELVPDGTPVYRVDVKVRCVGSIGEVGCDSFVFTALDKDEAKQKALSELVMHHYTGCGGVGSIEFSEVVELTGDEKACLHVCLSLDWPSEEETRVAAIAPDPMMPADERAPVAEHVPIESAGDVRAGDPMEPDAV